MSEQRLDRLDRAVERLMQAHQEALEACEQALGSQDEILDGVRSFIDDTPAPRAEEGRLYRAALENVLDILVGASEDVELILGEGSGSSD